MEVVLLFTMVMWADADRRADRSVSLGMSSIVFLLVLERHLACVDRADACFRRWRVTTRCWPSRSLFWRRLLHVDRGCGQADHPVFHRAGRAFARRVWRLRVSLPACCLPRPVRIIAGNGGGHRVHRDRGYAPGRLFQGISPPA